MEKQNINDYFIMLGKVFEWICYESKDEVELSGVYYENGEAKLKPYPLLRYESGLCIGTIKSAFKAYDREHNTNYYELFELATEYGLDHTNES